MGLFKNEDTYNHAFLSASHATGVPVPVLKGLAGMESAFNPKAFRAEPQINDASRGLLQILNRTAQAVGFRGKPDDLFDPTINANYGARFLRDLILKYKNLPDAVASYNMGHPRPASKTTPTIIKIYGEPKPSWVYANQPYVDRVLAYIAYYQAQDRRDSHKMAEIADALKKKVLPPLPYWPNPFILAEPKSPPTAEQPGAEPHPLELPPSSSARPSPDFFGFWVKIVSKIVGVFRGRRL